MEYVPTKINESLFEKMSQLEEQEGNIDEDNTPKPKSSSFKRANSKKKATKVIRNKRVEKKSNFKGINLVEKKREIHEAYQVVLNEYHRRLGLRRKSLEQTDAFQRNSIKSEDLKTHFESSTNATEGRFT